MTFPDAVFAALRAESGRVVVEQGPRQVTATELLDMIARIAGGMRARGVKQGTGIAMDTSVTAEALAAYLAGFALGARIAGAGDEGADLLVTDEEITSLLAAESEPLLVTSRPKDIARLDRTSGEQTYEEMSADRPRPEPGLPSGGLQSVAVQDYLLGIVQHGGVAVIPLLSEQLQP